MRAIFTDLGVELVATRNAVTAHLGRAVRRTVLTLGALMVAAGTTIVLLAWSVS